MRKANWQVLDKEQIIDLIVKHNASIEPLRGEQERRVRGKLENMDAVALWKHIDGVYDGVLYEPDSVLVDPLELKRREMEQTRAERDRQKARERARINYHIEVTPPCLTDKKHDAHTYFYGKDYVLNVFEAGDGLIVLTTRPKHCRKLAQLHYPTVKIECLKPEGQE